ncbi:MAG: hypothetical protein ABIA04_04305 [Pseudomonadota bacterium]
MRFIKILLPILVLISLISCFEEDDLAIDAAYIFEVTNAHSNYSSLENFLVIEGAGFSTNGENFVYFPNSTEAAENVLVNSTGSIITVPIPDDVEDGVVSVTYGTTTISTESLTFATTEQLTDGISPQVTLLSVIPDTNPGTYVIDFNISDDTAVTIVSSTDNETLSYEDNVVFYSGSYRLTNFTFSADSTKASITVADFAGNIATSNEIDL